MTVQSNSDFLKQVHAAISNLLKGLTMFGLAYSLSTSKTRASYRRTFLGPFWLSIEQLFITTGFFAISSSLFNNQVTGRIEHVALGLVGFGLVSGMISGSADLPSSFQAFKNSQLPIAFGVLAQVVHLWHLTLYRLIGVVPLLVFGTEISLRPFLVIGVPVAAAVLTCFGLGVGLFIGIVSIRFRDLKPILDSVTRIAFFCTPVFWRLDDIQQGQSLLDLRSFDTLNPYSLFTNLFRLTIQSENLSQLVSASVAIWMSAFSIVGITTYLIFHHKIRSWL